MPYRETTGIDVTPPARSGHERNTKKAHPVYAGSKVMPAGVKATINPGRKRLNALPARASACVRWYGSPDRADSARGPEQAGSAAGHFELFGDTERLNPMAYMGYREEGDTCPERQCGGKLGYEPVDGCSCHISPPCAACTSNPLRCAECGWTDDTEPEYRDVVVCDGLSMRQYKPRPLDNSKIDYRIKMHTHFSQIVEGVYPGGVTRDEVESKVRGTFGGRFAEFGGGKFRYIAYTD